MKLTVEVHVKLGTAKVELTRDQRNEVIGYVTKLLTGKAGKPEIEVKPKRGSRMFGARKWTDEEDIKLLDIVEKGNYTSKTKAYRAAAIELKRTPSACLGRYFDLTSKKGDKNKRPTTNLLED